MRNIYVYVKWLRFTKNILRFKTTKTDSIVVVLLTQSYFEITEMYLQKMLQHLKRKKNNFGKNVKNSCCKIFNLNWISTFF